LDLAAVLEEEGVLKGEEFREEAYRLFFNLHPDLKLKGVIRLYERGDLSIGRAAEILGITIVEFKELLAAKGIIREMEGKFRKKLIEN